MRELLAVYVVLVLVGILLLGGSRICAYLNWKRKVRLLNKMTGLVKRQAEVTSDLVTNFAKMAEIFAKVPPECWTSAASPPPPPDMSKTRKFLTIAGCAVGCGALGAIFLWYFIGKIGNGLLIAHGTTPDPLSGWMYAWVIAGCMSIGWFFGLMVVDKKATPVPQTA